MTDKQTESFFLNSIKNKKKRENPRSYGACETAANARIADLKGFNPKRIADKTKENDQTTSFISSRQTCQTMTTLQNGQTASYMPTNPLPSNTNSDDIEEDEETSYNCTRMTGKDFAAVWRIFLLAFVDKFISFSLLWTIVPYSVSTLGFNLTEAYTTQWMFIAGCFLVPFFGGIVTDEWTGGFISIFASSVLSFIGSCLLLASSLCSSGSICSHSHIEDVHTDSTHPFITGLVLIAVGGGIFLASIIPFGVQQVWRERSVSFESYILWSIWYYKAAELFYVTVVEYLITETGFTTVFVLMLILRGLAMITFLQGKNNFVHKSAQAGIFDSVFATIAARIIKRRSWSLPHVQQEQVERMDRLVEAIKAVIRIFPMLPLMILFCLIWIMILDFQVKQTARMDSGAWYFAEPSLISYIICILVLIPVLDRLVYPYLHRNKRSPSLTQKLVIGLILAMAAMLCTGVLEMLRKEDMVNNGFLERNVSGIVVNASKITRTAQIPQFTLIGASEVLSFEPGLTFMFTEAPDSMKGIFIGLLWFTFMFGHLLLYLYKLFVRLWKTNDETDWYPIDPNKGHIEYAMFLVIGFICLYLVFFAVFRSRCCRKRIHKRTSEDAT